MNRKFRSIRFTLLGSVTLMILIFTILLVIMINRQANKDLTVLTDENLAQIATQSSMIIEDRLQGYLGELQVLATEDMFSEQKRNKKIITEKMQQIAEERNFSYLYVSDTQGNTYISTGVETNIIDRDYFQIVMDGKSTVTNPMLSKTGTYDVFFVVPIKDAQGKVIGLLGGARDASELSRVISDITYMESGEAFMVDSKGTIIAHKNQELVLNEVNYIEEAKENKEYKSLAEQIEGMRSGEIGVGEYKYLGIDKYVGYHPIVLTQWSIAITVPRTEIFATVTNIQTAILIISGVLVIICILFLFVFLGRLLRPITTISHEMDAIALGDVNRTIEDRLLQKPDEIGMLARGMHKIIQSLNEKSAAINALSLGDLDTRIEALSDKDILASAIQNIIKSLIEKTEAIRELALGYTDVKVEMKSQKDVLAIAIGEITEGLREKSKAAMEIAGGNLNVSLYEKSDKDELSKSMIQMATSINALILEIKDIIEEASNGNLNYRGDETKFMGAYGEIISGINHIIDSFAEPMKNAGELLGRMSHNDFTMKMDGNYKGMIRDFSNQINEVRDRLLGVQEAMERVANGDFSLLDEYHAIGRRSDHDRLTPAIIEMMEAVMRISKETGNVATAAQSGELGYRIDVSRFKGSYLEVVNGLNSALDAIAAPISETTKTLIEIAKGNLNVSVKGDYTGCYLEMKDSIEDMVSSFNELIGDITSASEQVASGASQVSDGSTQLSQGATEQASSIEELSASMTQIAVQTKMNATNAGTANQLALKAKESAVEGNQRMNDMLKAMIEINEASENISKIIKVIDDIAFQTNILALNAAVEAARAGQYGKGFAVVAEEVRNLAARSADAAKETTEYIEGSIKKVEGGSKIANETAEVLTGIMDGSVKVAELVGEIANASNEQASGIAQINQGIEQVSKVIQMNSSTAQQSAAASEELLSQAEILYQNIANFELRDMKKNDRQQAKKEKTTARSTGASSGKNYMKPGNSDFGGF